MPRSWQRRSRQASPPPTAACRNWRRRKPSRSSLQPDSSRVRIAVVSCHRRVGRERAVAGCIRNEEAGITSAGKKPAAGSQRTPRDLLGLPKDGRQKTAKRPKEVVSAPSLRYPVIPLSRYSVVPLPVTLPLPASPIAVPAESPSRSPRPAAAPRPRTIPRTATASCEESTSHPSSHPSRQACRPGDL